MACPSLGDAAGRGQAEEENGHERQGREGDARRRRGICLMPDDIHSIHTTGNAPTRHLHMYGLALERLDDRKAFDVESGRVIPYNRNFMQPTAAPSAPGKA